MFGVQLYKNNARALLSRILSILNLDWLQHARSVRGVYECSILLQFEFCKYQHFNIGKIEYELLQKLLKSNELRCNKLIGYILEEINTSFLLC